VWIARAVIVGGALMLSLLVVAIGLALSAVEGRDERDTFSVVGAKPSTMRRLTASRAAVISLVGIVLGVPLGFIPVWVVDSITTSPYETYDVPVTFPWLVVATLAVVIPLLAAGGAWAASGVAHRFRPASPTRRD
jgi:putative ABC transport system permease protein